MNERSSQYLDQSLSTLLKLLRTPKLILLIQYTFIIVLYVYFQRLAAAAIRGPASSYVRWADTVPVTEHTIKLIPQVVTMVVQSTPNAEIELENSAVNDRRHIVQGK